MKNLYIGLMSGTSMDAVDAVLIEFNETSCKLIAHHTQSMPNDLRQELTSLCTPGHDEINRCGRTDVRVGKLFAATTNQLLKNSNISAKQICAIGSHGQTIRHSPNGEYPFTLQIGDPNIIAQETGITTVADFRRRDIAAGGQGAPLAPAFHNYLFRSDAEDRILLNIGGIANITWLPRDPNLPVIGFDTGPGNTLLDNWINKHLQKNFDENGEWAAGGKVDDKLLKLLLADPYFQLSHPKSTGREYFNLTWLTKILSTLTRPSGTLSRQRERGILEAQDVQTTLCELTAQTIAQAIHSLKLTGGKILICGGGIKNNYLIQRIKHHANNFSIHSTEEFGMPPQSLEAAAFAWLAQQTLEKKTGNLPSVTGARDSVVLGGVYYKTYY